MAEKKCTAKRKYEDEHRTFFTEWKSLYFFVKRNSKSFCLICQASLAHFKASNLQRHFKSLHANINREFAKAALINSRLNVVVRSPAPFGLGRNGYWPSRGSQLPRALPIHFFAMLPPERPQKGSTQHL